MSSVALVLFWVSIGVLAWVYLLYPLLARAYGRLLPVRLVTSAEPPHLVTVGLAVHDGAAQIVERITDIVAEPVPFTLEVVVASDGSTDATGAIVSGMSAADARIRLLELSRRGQSAAQAAIFEAARGEVVVLTDIETRFAPGCLAALVAPFIDRRVGCTTGVLRWRWDARTATARDEGLYWRYEQAVRSWESRAGWLSAATGALLAVRRDLYRPAPAHASLDQMLPLYCRQAGALVVLAVDATGGDRGPATLSEQMASRVRIATQGIEANLRMSRHIVPWRQPGAFASLWSHKILRWASPFLGMIAAVGGAGLWLLSGDVGYGLVAALAVATGLLALIGYAGARSGRTIPGTGFALTIVAVNLAFATAWLNVLTRRRVRAWDAPLRESGLPRRA
jgi:hypothetical protein